MPEKSLAKLKHVITRYINLLRLSTAGSQTYPVGKIGSDWFNILKKNKDL